MEMEGKMMGVHGGRVSALNTLSIGTRERVRSTVRDARASLRMVRSSTEAVGVCCDRNSSLDRGAREQVCSGLHERWLSPRLSGGLGRIAEANLLAGS